VSRGEKLEGASTLYSAIKKREIQTKLCLKMRIFLVKSSGSPLCFQYTGFHTQLIPPAFTFVTIVSI